MSGMLGEQERLVKKARKEHRCNLEHDCTIRPGDSYFIGITLPGDSQYPIGGGDYESVDWPFTVMKACVEHYNMAMAGQL
jgi:hypothetical protein